MFLFCEFLFFFFFNFDFFLKFFSKILENCIKTFVTLDKQDLIVEKLTGEDEGIVVWGLNRDKVAGNKNAMSRSMMTAVFSAFEEIRV